MTLRQELEDLAVAAGTRDKLLLTLLTGNVDNLTALTTTQKTNIVAAIISLKAEVDAAAQSGGAPINDTGTSTSSVWSSSKTSSEIAASAASTLSTVLGGAQPAYDTLQELKALLDASDSADDAAISSILTALGLRVRVDEAQAFTDPQKAQARANIGAASQADLGDVAGADLVATFEAALT